MDSNSSSKTPKGRLLDFILYKHITVRAFEKACGLGNAYIQNLTYAPSAKKLQCITEIFPELNVGWIMDGTGDMLTDSEASALQKKDVQIEDLRRLLRTNQELIATKDALIDTLQETVRLLREEKSKKGNGSPSPDPVSSPKESE